MNIKYHNFLNIEVTNSYFQNGICSVIDFAPSVDTAKSMKNYEILFRKRNNIISFYAGIIDGESFDLTTKFEGLQNMYFQLISEDPLFLNYTNLLSLDREQIFYFTNSVTTSTIQKSEFVSEEDIITIRPYKFLLALSQNNSKVEIKELEGSVVKEFMFQDEIKGEVSLYQLNSGVYELWMNEKKIETFFYSKTELQTKCLAILKLDMEQLIAQSSSEKHLTIDFEAREVYWQYQIIVPSSRKIEVISMEIIGNLGEVYEGPFEKVIVGGQITNEFTSSIPLKLKSELLKNPELKLSYIDSITNENNKLVIKLPNPNPENLTIYKNQQNEKSFCTISIVYV